MISKNPPNPSPSSSADIWKRAWDLFYSMKFAVWVLIITGGLSLFMLVLGEYIPPEAKDSRWLRLLGVSDPFRSWWFRLLLGLLSLSLLVCVIERTPVQIRLAFQRTFRTHPSQYLSLGDAYYGQFVTPVDTAKVEETIRKLVGEARHQQGEGWVAWSGSRGGLSRLGPLLAHFGLLLIIIGGLVMSLTSYSIQVKGGPGDRIAQPEWGFTLKVDTFRIEFYPPGLNMWVETRQGQRGKIVHLKGDSALVELIGRGEKRVKGQFSLQELNTGFEVFQGGQLVPFQGNISAYITEGKIIEGEREVPFSIKVNHPLRYKGFRFYQSSYEPSVRGITVDTLILEALHTSGERREIAIPLGGIKTTLPWDDLRVEVVGFYPDFRLDEQMRPFSASGEFRNPAAQLMVRRGDEVVGKTYAFLGPVGHMGSHNLPVEFSLKDWKGVRMGGRTFMTILNVHREGGREFIWSGLVVMTVGLILLYIFSHRQLWVLLITGEDGRQTLYLAGLDHRQPALFRQDLQNATLPLGVKPLKPNSPNKQK